MPNELRYPPADGAPVPTGSTVIYHLAMVDLMGAPASDAIGLDAMLLHQLNGILLNLRRGLAAALAPARDPREWPEK